MMGMGSNNGNGRRRWWEIWKPGNSDLADYRRLALQLHHGLPRPEGSARSVLVATPNESGVCARGCFSLAACMAEELQRPVLLVDASEDFEASRILKSQASPGLSDFLANPQRPLQDLVLPTSQENLHFLSRGTARHESHAAPDGVRDLLLRAARQWDFVVISGGAVLKNSFSLSIAPYVGRVLLLVMENRTHVDDIDAAQYALEQCRAPNVSLILTQRHG